MRGRGLAGADKCLIYALKGHKPDLRMWHIVKKDTLNLENGIDNGSVAGADELPNGEDSSNSNAVLRCRPGF